MKPEKTESCPIRGVAPEELARRFLQKPPKKEWRFMKRKGKS